MLVSNHLYCSHYKNNARALQLYMIKKNYNHETKNYWKKTKNKILKINDNNNVIINDN